MGGEPVAAGGIPVAESDFIFPVIAEEAGLMGAAVQHDDEHGEQHEGQAEVLLQHHDDKGEGPHDDERQQRRQARQSQASASPL